MSVDEWSGVCLVVLLSFMVWVGVVGNASTDPRPDSTKVIIVDQRHKVLVSDTESGRSWEAFEYNGQLVLIPGTEVSK